jgi:hypothetical protein
LTVLPDSTEVDPIGHKVVFENEHFRVLEVRNPTGHHIPMHSHPPRLIVAVGGYRIRSVSEQGTESIADRRPGEVIWVEHEAHEADILVGPTHVIEVEVKTAT